MNELLIDKKRYVLLPLKDYELLQRKALLKTQTEKTLTLAEARAYSKQLIRKWAKEK